jgi:transcriptional regulator with XRE-family HTH domain
VSRRQLLYLRYKREGQGWTQDRLAFESKLSANTISKIDVGRINPTPEELQKLATALGVEPASALLEPMNDIIEATGR